MINARLTDNINVNGDRKVLNNDGSLNTNASFDAWTSISTEYKPFTGTFDGQNHTISGLYINGTTGYVGLFGCVGTDGTAIGAVKKSPSRVPMCPETLMSAACAAITKAAL